MDVRSLPWYYLPAPLHPGHEVVLNGDEWHHCHQVLRMREGDRLLLFDGLGMGMEGVIVSAEKNRGTIAIEADRTADFNIPRRYRIVMGMAPTKQIDRTEYAIEKLTELGVDEICLLDCQHGERTHIRRDRLEKIIISAAKQSRKLYLPILRDLTAPEELINEYRTKQENVQVLCCHLDPSATFAGHTVEAGRNVMMLVGPEGGFSREEIERFEALGVAKVVLGPYRLRVETAAIAACVLIHAVNA